MVADQDTTPLLATTSEREAGKRSQPIQQSQESTPLLSASSNSLRYDGGSDEDGDEDELISSPAASSLRSIQEGRISNKSAKGTRAWPTSVAVSLLTTVVVLIMVAAFVTPATVEEYAKQAMVIDLTELSINSVTSSGVKARIQAKFQLDASRVKNKNVRSIGRFGTWMTQRVQSQELQVDVYLPEYGNLLLGTASVPKIDVSIRNGDTTHLDFLSDLQAGDVDGFRRVANDWSEGMLRELRVQGKANISLNSGVFSLGTQSISKSLIIEGNKIPSIPQYNISSFHFFERSISPGEKTMAADVSLSLTNTYPVRLSFPPLAFEILVPNCGMDETPLLIADAITRTIDIVPNSYVKVEVDGIIHQLPERLTKACPHTNTSPLDLLLGSYIHGQDTTIFVTGSRTPAAGTPEWITGIMSSITIPVPFPGHTFDGAVKNFSIANVNFDLPNPFAEPGSPESRYRITGDIQATAALPDAVIFRLDISHVRASANVFFKGKQLGVLDLKKWQSAKSTRLAATGNSGSSLLIESHIKDAPLNITDEDVLTDVATLLLSGEDVSLTIEALVDVEVKTVLGTLVVRDLPGQGTVPIQAPVKGGFGGFAPQVGDLHIINTSETSIALEATVNFTNPTPYTAQVPYLNIHILSNGSILGQAIARNITVIKGNNTNVVIGAIWDPYTMGGKVGLEIGQELLSQYISGWNTTLTFRAHEQSVPSQPELGRVLSGFNITIRTPRLKGLPSSDGRDNDRDDEGNAPEFIQDATFHLLSSTATFTLISPLQYSTLFVDRINATAFYNHTEPVGTILYDFPFKVPPGKSVTPRLPVAWSFDSVGYEKLRRTLGGKLKLDAEATVGITLDRWSEELWYKGGGIGAQVKL